ncbi:uncharacterized protein LOC113365667 [Ctenocephalides felis]|uniref:uncharacterized protein LOC113365667 n=1 Tax=Ctenocephalides felis TaxID=7515 RepID=UPI000E6E3506|nr:uncharacterized protein LOC113365667 [Ctenocephalides felis]
MKKIRETLEPWNPLSIFSKGKPPPNRQEPENNGFVKKGVEKSKSAEPIGHIFEKPKVVAKKLLAKSPSNEGFYSVNPVVVEDQFQAVWTPLDFDIDALYAVPRKRNKINRNEQTMELSYANLADSKFQPLTIKTSGEELHYQIVKPKPLRCKRSKSAQNLHKSELKVFLQRTPSCEIDAVYDVPGKAKPVGKIDKNTMLLITLKTVRMHLVNSRSTRNRTPKMIII